MIMIKQICPVCAHVFKWGLLCKTKGVCDICGSYESWGAVPTGASMLPLGQDNMELRLKMEVYRRSYGDEEFKRRYPGVLK
jgi:hypothetical protein